MHLQSLFFFNDTATTEIYTLSLHDALPISWSARTDRAAPRTAPAPRPTPCCPEPAAGCRRTGSAPRSRPPGRGRTSSRSEEHTSELQSRQYLVCRLLLEKKKKKVSSRACSK